MSRIECTDKMHALALIFKDKTEKFATFILTSLIIETLLIGRLG